MIDLKTIECRYCGNHEESLFRKKDSNLICKCCGSWYQYEDSDEQRECAIGMSQLRRYKFDEARDTFEYVITRYPNSVSALWGLLLSRFGVVFVKGFYKNVTEPIYCFHNYDRMKKRYMQSEPEYEKILSLLKDDDELRFDYEKKARKIDNALDNFKKYKKTTERDVFICVKISAATHEHPERTGRTEDYSFALKVYEDLKKRGINVFFSFVTLKNDVDSDEKIWRNLVQSKKMLLIGSSEEYLESPWVKSEWKRWLYLNREEDLYIYVMNNEEYESPFDILPNELADNQIYTQETYNKLLSDICCDCGKETGNAAADFFEEEIRRSQAAEQEARIRQEELRRQEEQRAEAQRREEEARRQANERQAEPDGARSAGDPSEAEQYYKTGSDYYRGENGSYKDFKKAVEYFAKAAVLGNANAQYMLGYCYANALGTEQKYEKAVEWYAKAAEQGHTNAQNGLGACYEQGTGVAKDLAKAFELYSKAAVCGNAYAQKNLGECYYYGRSVPIDYAKAVNWYKKSASQNLASAQYCLGYCYEYGQGIEKDMQKALELYTKAAEQKHGLAQKALDRLKTTTGASATGSTPLKKKKGNFFTRNFFGMFAIAAFVLMLIFYNGGELGKALYALTPLGLGASTGIENFGFSMVAFTIATVLSYILVFLAIKYISHEKDNLGLVSYVINFAASIGVWYAGYGLSHLLVKITWGFHFFTVLAAILACALFTVAVLFLSVLVEAIAYDGKNDAENEFRESCGLVNVKFIVSLTMFHVGFSAIGYSENPDAATIILMLIGGAVFSLFYAIKRIVVFCGKDVPSSFRSRRKTSEVTLLWLSVIALVALFVAYGGFNFGVGNALLEALFVPAFITLPFVIIFRAIAVISMKVKK